MRRRTEISQAAEEGPRSLACAVIGPRGAGKTSLLASLRHRPDLCHSFRDRFAVSISDPSVADPSSGGEALGRLWADVDARLDAQSGDRRAQRRGFSFPRLFRSGPSDASEPASPPSTALSDLREEPTVGAVSDPGRDPFWGFGPFGPAKDGAAWDRGAAADGPGAPRDAGWDASAEPARRSPSHEAGFRAYGQELDAALADGLAFAPTVAPRRLSLEMQLRALTPWRGGPPGGAVRTRVELADLPGDLPAGALTRALDGTDAALLCLPIDAPPASAEARRELADLLGGLADPMAAPSLRRIVVALTKAERVVVGEDGGAFEALADPARARERIADALHGPWAFLQAALFAAQGEEADGAGRGGGVVRRGRAWFGGRPRRRVVVQPLSTFGFIPYHGGANVDPSGARLLTKAPSGVHPRRVIEAPYTHEAVQDHYWRPFLTVDPFVFLAVGAGGATTFPLAEAMAG